MRRILLFLVLFTPAALQAQTPCSELPFIRGLRVFGGDREDNLPVILQADTSRASAETFLPTYITIRFDVHERMPPRLVIRFHHCDKDWNIDTDYFVRDDFFTYSRELLYEGAPTGADHFLWRFENRFPSEEHSFVRFLYSGNWIFDIVDERDQESIYASGRFIVVENRVRAGLSIRNDYWTDWDSPYDQVHRLDLDIAVKDQKLFPDYVRTVDFYKNFNLFEQYRVDSYDRRDNTFVEGIGLKEKTFTYRNVPPGNGYRFYDLRSPSIYAEKAILTKFEGPDFTRFRFSADASRYHGSSVTTPLNSFDTDYLCVQFELEHPEIDGRDVFVAGLFNQWDPQATDQLEYDKDIGHYIGRRWLLRGAYDYQYVLGTYDEELGYVANQDWIALAGNTWAANNLYWVIVYYDDDEFGGVTRAVGFAAAVAGR
ncbi:MAG: hypothetical protein C0600_06350 [Ignavibacteria bacterium]|nr:MAG: hypothetical protein C0600_06350 [Ignavibacteria bacterium]